MQFDKKKNEQHNERGVSNSGQEIQAIKSRIFTMLNNNIGTDNINLYQPIVDNGPCRWEMRKIELVFQKENDPVPVFKNPKKLDEGQDGLKDLERKRKESLGNELNEAKKRRTTDDTKINGKRNSEYVVR